MTTKLTEKQRRDLLELIINDRLMKKGDIDRPDRDRLVEDGLIELVEHPTSKRTKRIVATEAAWAWAVDHFDEPFSSGNLQVRDIWNGLARRLKENLARREENLATFLAEASPEEHLRSTYLRLTGGELRRGVRLAQLRTAAGIDRSQADAALLTLVREHHIVLYPDDERDRITAEDRAAALSESGVAKHIIYWED